VVVMMFLASHDSSSTPSRELPEYTLKGGFGGRP
jgi:hypothetical protein